MRGLAFYANHSPQTRVARPPSFADSPILQLGSHASFTKSAPLGQSAHCKKQKIGLPCNFFFDWGLSPVPAKRKQSIIWAIYCVFEPISAFCRSATIPNRKKVATQADFLFSTFQNVIELTP